MASSSSCNVIGASEHNVKNKWIGALAFCSVGLPGKAFENNSWEKQHARMLQKMFSNLLWTEQKPQGILLCEVGTINDPITPKGQNNAGR